jgi:hypothetical protein
LFIPLALALAACAPGKNEEAAVQAVVETSEPVYALLKVPAGETTPADLLDRVSGWQRIGQVREAVWLNSNQTDSPGFATVVTLEFPGESVYSQWESQNAATLTAAVNLKRADRLTHAETIPRDSTKAVFKANYYQPKVPPARFREFARGYIEKFMEVQRQANLLTSYSMFLERGERGQALLILEHLDKPTYDTVTPVKEKLRAALMERDAGYKQYEDTAANYRDAVSGTTADYVRVE